ncbi:GFA family protein [Altererythrobacter sp. MF3-039]|uniref:GFA family protein n=1 Tax=Altererythrobacter sp. MF3-039 TaxID=3252901 RepID=UPI00390C56E8
MLASCQCGALTATVSGDSARVVCHCIDCQKRSGSPFGYIAYYSTDRVEVSGESREYIRPTDLGGTFTNRFCPTCGSTILVQAGVHPDKVGIPVGAFADQNFAPPHRAVYDDRRHDWITLPEDLPTFAKGRSTASSKAAQE